MMVAALNLAWLELHLRFTSCILLYLYDLNDERADGLTILQYPSQADRTYAKQFRQKQWYSQLPAQIYNATSYRNVEQQRRSTGQQQLWQSCSSVAFVPTAQGSVQGQGHFAFLPKRFTYYWYCCYCEYGGASLSLNDKCPEPSCQHMRCNECLVDWSDNLEQWSSSRSTEWLNRR